MVIKEEVKVEGGEGRRSWFGGWSSSKDGPDFRRSRNCKRAYHNNKVTTDYLKFVTAHLFISNCMLFKADKTDGAGVEASTKTGGKVRQVLCSQRRQVSSLTLTLVEA